MRDQFPASVRHSAEQGSERRWIERSCRQHADRSVGRVHSSIDYILTKLSMQAIENAHLQPPQRGRANCGIKTPFGLKRIAHGSDTVTARSLQQGDAYGWEHVGVLVGIHV